MNIINKSPKLTEDERKILDYLADAWNEFCNLDYCSEHDVDDFNNAIHTCQRIIAIRQARRANPDYWRQPNK